MHINSKYIQSEVRLDIMGLRWVTCLGLDSEKVKKS